MTEIERRLYKYYRITRYGGTTTRQRAREAIIEPWNAAVAAMKALVHATITKDNTGWYCSKCRGSQEFHPERHAPAKCPVAAAQAALARMNGLHDGQDVV